MKAVINITIFLILYVNTYSQGMRSDNFDSLTICVDSMVFKNIENTYDKLKYLELNQNRWSNKKYATISDSIALLQNLQTLNINTKQSLLISDSLYKLKKLKEIFIATTFLKSYDLSFYNSKSSLENIKILNYGSGLILLKDVFEYSNLKTLLFLQDCKNVKDKKRLINFFIQLNNLELEGFKFVFSNISRKELQNLNLELKKRNLKYRITSNKN